MPSESAGSSPGELRQLLAATELRRQRVDKADERGHALGARCCANAHRHEWHQALEQARALEDVGAAGPLPRGGPRAQPGPVAVLRERRRGRDFGIEGLPPGGLVGGQRRVVVLLHAFHHVVVPLDVLVVDGPQELRVRVQYGGDLRPVLGRLLLLALDLQLLDGPAVLPRQRHAERVPNRAHGPPAGPARLSPDCL